MTLSTACVLSSIPSHVQQACEEIQQRSRLQPRVAIILGSGLGGLASDVDDAITIPYVDIPGFLPTHALGHVGNLILGTLAAAPVAVLQGRSHRYEGYTTDQVVFPVQCVCALGATTLISTNAAGGLNPRYQRGDIMAIDQHIHWQWSRGHQSRDIDRSIDECTLLSTGQVLHGISPYCPQLIGQAAHLSILNHRALHRGTYLSTLGPTYETRAEYRMFRWMGADAVGMSTTAEVLAGQRLGMRILALSVITNVASTDVPQATTHAEVVDVGNQAEPHLRLLIHGLMAEMTRKAH